ncbi:bifunctional glycosyltransferase/CDP-glycerol:glycerophosphate glycerophosphotransferase [Xiamenia xianingshaonis]|nr:glycosyltransferase [Xiamenia xianingshaonis]QTU84178.1 glycosyltransferase [Xiamenia xianingshaonis]
METVHHDDNALVASVIIPVYNKEKFLARCFDSLKAQTLPLEKFEVVLVDDGSSDDSLRLCQEFARELPHATVIAKENGGVSAARNDAIAQAQGTYLFFVDPDDGLSPNVLEHVSTFFDAHFSEVDLVTYPIISIDEKGRHRALHYRYDIMKTTGVYDLTSGDGIYICQTTVNVCVKNTTPKPRFDFVSHNGVEFHEDQQFITDILLPKMKIGYCKDAAYYWYDNDESVTSQRKTAYYLFDNTMFMYEQLFARFQDAVPQYVQSLLVNDIGWKLRQNALLPTYLAGEAYEKELGRLVALLKRVDDEVLINHPNVHEYHRYYFINLKDTGKLSVLANENGVALLRGEKVLYENETIELLVMRVRIRHGRLKMMTVVKSPVLPNFEGDVSVWMRTTTSEGEHEEPLVLTDSSRSRIATKDVVSRFFDARIDIDLARSTGQVSFFAKLDDVVVPIRLAFGINAEIAEALDGTWFADGWLVRMQHELPHISVSRISKKEERKMRTAMNLRVKSKAVMLTRFAVDAALARKRKSKRPIWVYTDSARSLDNGWKQFLHDQKKHDGVSRYYAANGIDLADPRLKGVDGVVPFHGKRHKMLFCLADKLLCSDIDRGSYHAFGMKLARSFVNYFNAEIIYLQHGVLWAHMPWYYSYDRTLCDFEVISTPFENKNLCQNYGFAESDLIPCGMTRYDYIDAAKQPERKILVCPSWRSYLVGKLKKNGRSGLKQRFLSSDYYKEVQALLSNPKLQQALETHDFELELKLHPQFKMYEDLFHFEHDRVKLAPTQVDETEYAIVLTDYSSYSFDFVYLKRGIIYFIPDPEFVFNGSNHYSQLDIPLDNAFGEYAENADEAVDALVRLMEHDGKPLAPYREKMERFFYHYDDHQGDRLYEFLTKNRTFS